MAEKISRSNLYTNGRIVNFDDGTGESVLIRDKITFTGDERDKYHPVIDGDRLDLLAYKYYGAIVDNASKYWWVIADANNIHNPFDLSSYVGQDILIPEFAKVDLRT